MLIKLERNEPTADGVNRFAEVEDSKVDKWLATGKWQVIGGEPQIKDDPVVDEAVDVIEPVKKRRKRKPKKDIEE